MLCGSLRLHILGAALQQSHSSLLAGATAPDGTERGSALLPEHRQEEQRQLEVPLARDSKEGEWGRTAAPPPSTATVFLGVEAQTCSISRI